MPIGTILRRYTRPVMRTEEGFRIDGHVRARICVMKTEKARCIVVKVAAVGRILGRGEGVGEGVTR